MVWKVKVDRFSQTMLNRITKLDTGVACFHCTWFLQRPVLCVGLFSFRGPLHMYHGVLSLCPATVFLGPSLSRTSLQDLWNVWLMQVWLIWFSITWSGDLHVALQILLCKKMHPPWQATYGSTVLRIPHRSHSPALICVFSSLSPSPTSAYLPERLIWRFFYKFRSCGL